MTERPILFQGAMVRALLAGTKTQTRRALRRQFPADAAPVEIPATDPAGGWVVSGHSGVWWCDAAANIDEAQGCPYGVPGDRLWVREAWAQNGPFPDDGALYRANFPEGPLTIKFKPSIHMPRWASRITLDITGVRVERLQDISRGDAMAEGCPFPNMAQGDDPRRWYAELWEQINGPGSWVANPWVWVVEFRRLP